jgi:Heparinase II/III-like protein/Heparinase II/III N-terminus
VSVATGFRPVFCVIEHLHRDRAVAEEVADGRFTLQGTTCDLGTRPDWLGADLPADEEWRIEWVKFYYGLDLAHAYRETSDERFLTAWERLVGSWIRQMPFDADSSDVTARRILNWIYAWQGFGAGELDRTVVASIGEQARHVRATLSPERNHRTLELYALLIVALALPELDPGGAVLDLAVAELDRNLAADFRPDGVHREASTHYHMVALRSLAGLRENARRFGLALPEGFDERLSRACDFALHCMRPDGTIPALSDSDTGDYAELLALTAELLDRDDLRWAGSRGERGRPPDRRAADFPDGGYFIQRSGWDPGAAFLIFDCGPLGDGGHGHYDLLGVEVFAAGRPLLVDPGRGSYSEEPPNWRRWFRGTAAHNTVCVDGHDQTPYTRGRPAGFVAQGRFLGRSTIPRLDVLWGEAVSPAYDAVHRRRVAFVDDRCWVIEDRLSGQTPHRYDLRFQLGSGPARLEGSSVIAPGLTLTIFGAHAVTLESGWIAPRYGEWFEAPVVSAVAEGRDATFVTLVTPAGKS